MAKKYAKIKSWMHHNRLMTLDIRNENQLTFKGSNHFQYDPEKYSLRTISRIQKRLRQFFWSYLKDNNLNPFYILVIDGRTKPTADTVFLELNLTFENTLKLNENKAICQMIFDMMCKELEIIK